MGGIDIFMYILEELKDWWDYLWEFHPFPDTFFDFSAASLLIGFSALMLLLDYFNGESDDDDSSSN